MPPRVNAGHEAATPANQAESTAKDVRALAQVLVFVLPDCPICNAYVPTLNRLAEAYAARGVAFRLVHVDPDVTAEQAQAHAREYGIRWPIVVDFNHAWASQAGATTAPEAAVFSPQGELLYRGRIDNQFAAPGQRRATVTSRDLVNALEAILAGRSVPEPRTAAVGCPIPKLPSELSKPSYP